MQKLKDAMNSIASGTKKFFMLSVKIHQFAWRDFRGTVIILTVLTLIGTIFSYANRAFMGLLLNRLIDTVSGKQVGGMSLAMLLGLLLVSLIVPRLTNAINQFFNMEFTRHFQHFYETAIYRKSAALDFASHDNPKRNDLFQKIKDNMWRLTNFYLRPLWALDSFLWVLATLLTLMTVNPWFGVLLFVSTLPELVIEARTGYRMWGIWSAKAEIRRRYSVFTGLFNRKESITELKLFDNVSYFIQRITKLFFDFDHEQTKVESRRLFWSISASLFSQGGVIIVAAWMINMTVHSEIKIGTFAFLFTLIMGFQQSLSQFFRFLGQQSEDSHHAKDFFDYLELENTVIFSSNGVRLPLDPPTICFENVSFAYPETERCVLQNVSLEIKPGEKLAIVGVNGAGKSTLIKLLFRFYDPTEGRILVNGIDLKDVDIYDWYAHLGALFQEFVNYKLPLREAVSVGNTHLEINDAKVLVALNKGEATGFMSGWKDGIYQQLGKEFTDGVEPSVGQWQKLALARVFYRDANVYVLDEPTSAIDAEAEANVFENLAKLPVDKTVVFVSHRFSTIRQANRICVIEDGKISELGTHEELIMNNATYKRLFELQAKGYQ